MLLCLFFAPAALGASDSAKSGDSEQKAHSANEKSQKTPDQTPDDHPSGKDRSVEPGGSGTQGKSASDPDGDSNGGADKPGMTGGFDADKDGNNGCGNDDDFEDDNNGWCGKKPESETAAAAGVRGVSLAKSAQAAAVVETAAQGEAAASVLGETFVRSAVASGQVSGSTAEVAGATAAAPAGTLAATGAGRGLTLLAFWGLALVSVGVMCMAADRRRLTPARVQLKR